MKKRVSSSSILLFVFLALFSTCRQSRAICQGKIEQHDGIIVVKNPIHPMYGEEIFGLEEELSIGAKEGLKEHMFSQVRDIDVDDDGNIYVLDQKESQIKVFDKNGR